MIKILQTGKNKHSQIHGFSLLELLVVLTIMSVLASSITLVMLNKNESLQTFSRKIVRNMQLVQQRAIREDQPVQIEINFSQNSFKFIEEVITLPEDVSITVRTAENQLIEDDLVGLTFYPDFSATGGVILIESEKESYEIIINWISGKITSKHHVSPI